MCGIEIQNKEYIKALFETLERAYQKNLSI